MYTIKEVSNSLELADLIKIANENKHSELDCDRETFINGIIDNMYKNKWYRITLLYAHDERTNNDNVIGYFILKRVKGLMDEVVVIDIYVTKEYQGMKCIQLLLDDAVPVLLKSKAKRVKWQSYIFDSDFWESHTFGAQVKSYEMFYINLDTENVDIYNKSKIK